MDTKQKDPKQEKSRYRYQSEIQQMMFVFGEVADPLPETTMLVEDIVRSQVIEIVSLYSRFPMQVHGRLQPAQPHFVFHLRSSKRLRKPRSVALAT